MDRFEAQDEASRMFGSYPRSLFSRRGRRAVAWAFLTIAFPAIAGCGYSFRAPFDKSVRTVYVPMFKSQAFARDIEKDLTRQVQQEIIQRSPYKLVSRLEDADTVLSGTINYVDKNIIVEAPTNLPRQLTRIVNVNVNWVHNPPTELEKSRAPTVVSETVNFVPETGETTLTATTKVNARLAAQIVDMMEQPWHTEEDLR